MNKENTKRNEPHKFDLNLSEKIDLRSSDKHVALQNLSIYYISKKYKKTVEKQQTCQPLRVKNLGIIPKIFKKPGDHAGEISFVCFCLN